MAEEPAAEEPAAEEPIAAERGTRRGAGRRRQTLLRSRSPSPRSSSPRRLSPKNRSPAEPATDEAPTEQPGGSQRGPKKKSKRLPRSQRRQRPKPKREQAATRKPIVRLPKPEADHGRRQQRRGIVVSAAMDKTIVVRVDSVKAHPKYKKVIRRSTRFHAHDEANQAKTGDVVRIVETRPLSKTKRWRLAEIVEVAK